MGLRGEGAWKDQWMEERIENRWKTRDLHLVTNEKLAFMVI